MQDKKVANGKSNDSGNTNNNPLKTAYARFKLLPVTWRIVGGALSGVIILGAVAYFLPNMKERMKFFTDAALSWLILFVVSVQAYIYSKQWDVMKRQAKSADESVVFGLRAYLGVHGVSGIDFDSKKFLIQFENIGKVPASRIEIKYDVEVRIPDRYADEQARCPPWKREGNLDWVNHWGDTRYYGRAKLFPGNLRIKIPVKLGWLSNAQLTEINKGNGKMFLKGNVEFSDGFNSGKNSPFAFHYSHEDGEWIVDAVITKEELEALLAERTKKYFGENEPQFNIIKAHVPREPNKTEKVEAKQEGNPN